MLWLDPANLQRQRKTYLKHCENFGPRSQKKQKVPPYIVFSDKTLAHMCIIKPVNKEEMLSVSGVGEFKYEKYGERFLAAVREQTE